MVDRKREEAGQAPSAPGLPPQSPQERPERGPLCAAGLPPSPAMVTTGHTLDGRRILP